MGQICANGSFWPFAMAFLFVSPAHVCTSYLWVYLLHAIFLHWCGNTIFWGLLNFLLLIQDVDITWLCRTFMQIAMAFRNVFKNGTLKDLILFMSLWFPEERHGSHDSSGELFCGMWIKKHKRTTQFGFKGSKLSPHCYFSVSSKERLFTMVHAVTEKLVYYISLAQVWVQVGGETRLCSESGFTVLSFSETGMNYWYPSKS